MTSTPLVSALLAAQGLAPEDVDLAVHPDDEMLGFLLDCAEGDRDQALAVYAGSGLSIAGAFRQLLAGHFGSVDRVGSLLDFASGYGRVTRFLLRHLRPERIWVSDVYAGGVRFQEERFGVHGFVSAPRPEELRCDRRSTQAWSSLFTHLPRALRRAGALTHHPRAAPLLQTRRERPGTGSRADEGIRFEAERERVAGDGRLRLTWSARFSCAPAIARAAGEVPVRGTRRAALRIPGL